MPDDTTAPSAAAVSSAAPDVPPAPLPSPPSDPFARPLSDVLGASADEGDDDEGSELEELPPAASSADNAQVKPEASGKKVPGRGGGGGPKMRRGQVERITKAKGTKTTPQQWAEVLRAEARKACEAAGVPLDDAAPSEEPATAGAPSEAAAEPIAEPAAETTGHRFTEARPEDLIYGQPAGQVLEAMTLTGGLWGTVARRCEGTRWDFSGEREMVAFPGTPFERKIHCNSERRLSELSAVLLVKHGSKLTGRVDTPEALFAGTLFFAFGPQALENALGLVRKAGAWWRRRRGGE